MQVVHRNPTHRRAATQKAVGEWLPNQKFGFPGERDDAWWRLVHGSDAPFEVLLEAPAGPGSDLATLAPKIWAPALDNVGSTS
uniref:Uncharacterized protein n=2 Tax=Janibacter limosus TaxID=53458 RepID=A0AC61U3R6_9MICO|nr:hypothetical protein [Janibacter limosus]